MDCESKSDIVRQQICEAPRSPIRDHMTGLPPMIRAHAANGLINSVHINSVEQFAAKGHREALQNIAGLLRDELPSGQSAMFPPTGLQFRKTKPPLPLAPLVRRA